jgi:hypothetical protein
MVKEDISLTELYETRERLINEIKTGMTSGEKEFLLSIKRGDPQWENLGIGDFSHLPGIKWKLINIKKMSVKKKIKTYSRLEAILKEDSPATPNEE